MATITSIISSELGKTIEWTEGGESGDKFENNNKQLLFIKYTGEGTVTVTITAQQTDATSAQWGDLTKSNATDTISNDEIIIMGPFATFPFNDSDGYVNVTYSSATGISVAVLDIQAL